MRQTIPITNFSAGELSPLLAAQVDLAKYRNGCELLENWLPLVYGGVTRRPGLHFVAEVKVSSEKPCLIPFEFSTIQAYMLEFGNQYIRFYRDNGRIESPPGTPIEIGSPYLEADLFQIKFAQSADVLYLAHQHRAPRKLTRTSHTAWTLTTIPFADGPFQDENTDLNWIITAFGGELVTNGLFTSDLSGWTDASVPTGSTTWGAGKMNLINVGGNKGASRQQITTIAGIVYTMTFTVGTGNLMLRIGTTAGGQQILADALYVPGSPSAVFMAAGPTTWIEFSNQVAGTTHTLDTVSIVNAFHVGSAVQLIANKDTWLPGHVGALWKLNERDGSPPYNNWKTLTAYVVGNLVVNAGLVYLATTAGTSGDRPPVHRSGNASDGGVQWAYINDGSGYIQITSVASPTFVNGIVKQFLPLSAATPGTARWQEGYWSDVQGYPGAVVFFEDRLVFAGSPQFPTHLWASEAGNYEGFKAGVDDDSAWIFQINSTQVNSILWLASHLTLLIGTLGAEHSLTGGNESAVTPTNVLVREHGARGSANVTPVKVSTNVLFVQRFGKKMRELKFSVNSDSYVAADLTILAEHITGAGLQQISYAQEPASLVWGVRSDGQLVALAYLPEQEVIGWSRHLTDGAVESVASIPTATSDQTWCVVRRTIDNLTKRYIEYFDPALNTDCALTYSGVPTTTLSGLLYLNGKTVRIKGDGAVLPSQIVPPSGILTLVDPVSTAEVGLDYVSRGRTVRPELKTQQGSIQGAMKRFAKIFVRLDKTQALSIGGKELSFRDTDDPMDAPPTPFTGDYDVTQAGYDRDMRIEFDVIDPMPATILGFFGVADIGQQ